MVIRLQVRHTIHWSVALPTSRCRDQAAAHKHDVVSELWAEFWPDAMALPCGHDVEGELAQLKHGMGAEEVRGPCCPKSRVPTVGVSTCATQGRQAAGAHHCARCLMVDMAIQNPVQVSRPQFHAGSDNSANCAEHRARQSTFKDCTNIVHRLCHTMRFQCTTELTRKARDGSAHSLQVSSPARLPSLMTSRRCTSRGHISFQKKSLMHHRNLTRRLSRLLACWAGPAQLHNQCQKELGLTRHG